MTDKTTDDRTVPGDDDATAIAGLLRSHLNSVGQAVAHQITSETVEARLAGIKDLQVQASDGVPVQRRAGLGS